MCLLQVMACDSTEPGSSCGVKSSSGVKSFLSTEVFRHAVTCGKAPIGRPSSASSESKDQIIYKVRATISTHELHENDLLQGFHSLNVLRARLFLSTRCVRETFCEASLCCGHSRSQGNRRRLSILDHRQGRATIFTHEVHGVVCCKVFLA